MNELKAHIILEIVPPQVLQMSNSHEWQSHNSLPHSTLQDAIHVLKLAMRPPYPGQPLSHIIKHNLEYCTS